jgi:hypothetical protein
MELAVTFHSRPHRLGLQQKTRPLVAQVGLVAGLASTTFGPLTSISTKFVNREPQNGAPRNARDN